MLLDGRPGRSQFCAMLDWDALREVLQTALLEECGRITKFGIGWTFHWHRPRAPLQFGDKHRLPVRLDCLAPSPLAIAMPLIEGLPIACSISLTFAQYCNETLAAADRTERRRRSINEVRTNRRQRRPQRGNHR
jgi:hypothetical protein